MRYPYERYLRYLLSRRRTVPEVKAACADNGLPLPADEDIEDLAQGLGEFPRSWVPVLSLGSTDFMRWLRDLDLLDVWREDAPRAAAFRLLKTIQMRRAVEGLLLLNPDEKRCREVLLTAYAAAEVPSAEAIRFFRQTFWSFQDMSPTHAIAYQQNHDKERDEVYYGLLRDESGVYGALGLRQRVDDIEFHDEVIAFAHQQLKQARRNGVVTDGKRLAGLAAVVAAAQRSLEARKEGDEERQSTLAESAKRFKLSRPVMRPLLTIDDIHPREEQSDGPGNRGSGSGAS